MKSVERGDWFNHCTHETHEARGTACDVADMLIKEPKKVAELLSIFLEWKAAQGLEINSVYFAAPPTEMEFILDVRTVRSPVRPRISSYVRLRTILRKNLKKKDIHILRVE